MHSVFRHFKPMGFNIGLCLHICENRLNMLERASKVNLKLLEPIKMKRLIVQIYEVQDPIEAQALVELGVDQIGSVVVSEKEWKNTVLKDTIRRIQALLAKSSLIPLFNNPDSVMRTLDYYQPDIVHFCETLVDRGKSDGSIGRLIQLQKDVKKKFPQIRIMRSIPIGLSGRADSVPTLEFSRQFESVSDFFLTDTLLAGASPGAHASQPVRGFVGITGTVCDWDMAARLVAGSRIPVILAGGISPGNVTQGILRVGPYGVDSCTRTNTLDESGSPVRFKKDLQKVKQLVNAVRKVEV